MKWSSNYAEILRIETLQQSHLWLCLAALIFRWKWSFCLPLPKHMQNSKCCRPVTLPLPLLSVHSETPHTLGKLPLTYKKGKALMWAACSHFPQHVWFCILFPEHIHGQNLTMTSDHTTFVRIPFTLRVLLLKWNRFTCACLGGKENKLQNSIRTDVFHVDNHCCSSTHDKIGQLC